VFFFWFERCWLGTRERGGGGGDGGWMGDKGVGFGFGFVGGGVPGGSGITLS